MKKTLLVGILLLLVGFAAQTKEKADKTASDKARIAILEAQVGEIANEHLARLYARTEDLNERLKAIEKGAGDSRAYWTIQGQVNQLDARVNQLERPDPEEDLN